MNDMDKSMNDMDKSMNDMGKSMNDMGKSMNDMGKSMNDMGKSMNDMGKSMNDMGKSMNDMGKSMNIWVIPSILKHNKTLPKHACTIVGMYYAAKTGSFIRFLISTIMLLEHIETETEWPQFWRQHFQIQFMFVYENWCISIQISLKFVSNDQINNMPISVVQMITQHRTGDK